MLINNGTNMKVPNDIFDTNKNNKQDDDERCADPPCCTHALVFLCEEDHGRRSLIGDESNWVNRQGTSRGHNSTLQMFCADR